MFNVVQHDHKSTSCKMPFLRQKMTWMKDQKGIQKIEKMANIQWYNARRKKNNIIKD